MNFTATAATIITEISACLLNAKSGDYFVNIDNVGIIRARKSSQVSWQWFGVGLPKAEITEICRDYAPENELEYTLIGGEYKIPLIKELILTGDKSSEVDDEDEMEEPPKKDKKKKDKKKGKKETDDDEKEEDVETPPTDKKKKDKTEKRDLDLFYSTDAIKGALKASGLFKKKQVKAILSELETNDDDEANGQDILDAIDAFQGEVATKEQADAVFSNL